MKQFLIRRWFLLALLLVLLGGTLLHAHLLPLVKNPGIRQSIVPVVMFLMALPLKAETIWSAMRRPGPPLLASGVNYVVTPLVAWAATGALMIWVGLSQDTGYGMLVAATTPCTLASAAVWTRRAGGNDTVSIMVTILTNSLCFLIMPAWLLVMIGQMPEFDPRAMSVKLGTLVVLPMIVAQLLRLYQPVGRWASEHKTPLGVVAQCGVLSMVFFGAIKTGRKLAGSEMQTIWIELVFMGMAMLAIHTTMLFCGLNLSRRLGLSQADATAVGFAGSQKTLMVGLEVSAQLSVTILPMVTYHVGQLLIDTLVADRLRRTQNAAEAGSGSKVE